MILPSSWAKGKEVLELKLFHINLLQNINSLCRIINQTLQNQYKDWIYLNKYTEFKKGKLSKERKKEDKEQQNKVSGLSIEQLLLRCEIIFLNCNVLKEAINNSTF